MTVFDCSEEISEFHDKKVTLHSSDRTEMQQRRNAGRTRLRTGLNEAGHPHPEMICSQGSYQMRTMVQDADCDYDIDDGVYFRSEDLKDDNGEELTPRQARERVCEALSRDQRFASPAKVHDNCVRQEYQAGYHIDMPVYRIMVEKGDDDKDHDVYDLASRDTWQRSDARAVTKWFKSFVSDLNGEDGDDGYQMRRIVRMTKLFARSRSDWKDQTTSGITLSKLVVDELTPSEGRDDKALLETWKAIEARLQRGTAVDHPINATPLTTVGDAKVTFFRTKLTEALNSLAVLEEDDCTLNEARAVWDGIFNTTFIGKLPDPDTPDGAKKSYFVATESKSDKRDDGNGRYGIGPGF